jgi:hypothetical protein
MPLICAGTKPDREKLAPGRLDSGPYGWKRSHGAQHGGAIEEAGTIWGLAAAVLQPDPANFGSDAHPENVYGAQHTRTSPVEDHLGGTEESDGRSFYLISRSWANWGKIVVAGIILSFVEGAGDVVDELLKQVCGAISMWMFHGAQTQGVFVYFCCNHKTTHTPIDHKWNNVVSHVSGAQNSKKKH